ncbi:MAG: GntR family transcriptional regulator [Verrucomicrobiae bacterium]|nr:GntR family transcriptional regulator [Verrucomicrobiae bacterium]MCP5540581.1 GntR family transcriptional regulator [Akkermansiaceae bacterium]MCP5550869.1 GntR family transcriptional regulator [Akkermansiaceae bacterium]
MPPSAFPLRTLRDQIADQLRNEILAHQHAPDAPLREHDLAKRFGTSRGPVRDVLLQLTQEGALVYRPNAGVRIGTPPDAETRKLLMRLRKEIELAAVKRLIEGFQPDDEPQLRETLDRLRRACRSGDMPGIVGSDMDLHRHIVRRGAAPEIEQVWQSIAVRILMAYSRLSDFSDIHAEHVRIVEAICARDVKASRAALESNLI